LEEQGKGKDNKDRGKKKENRTRVERKFVLFLIHTPFGLDLFDKLANTRAGRIYARFNVYLMPLITALALFLIVSSLVIVTSNSAARVGTRSLGPQANLLIPGLNPYLPWTYGWIALIVTIVIHEAGHGIVARVYNIRVESTGILLFLGIPIGAFVNISPEELSRCTLKQKSAILTAGPLNNMIVVAISLIALYFIVSTLTPIPTESTPQYGVTILGVGDHSLANSIGLSKGSIVESVAGQKIIKIDDLESILKSNLGKSIPITWKDTTSHQITRLANLPKQVNANEGILGVSISVSPNATEALKVYKDAFSFRSLNHEVLLLPPTLGAGEQVVPFSNLMAPKYHSSLGPAFYPLANMFYWLMFVNFNVAIFNTLPIGPLDGGQLYNSLLESKLRSKPNKLKNISSLITYAMVAIVAFSVLVPYFVR
jgi:membrane-associated protease RseP (regulator of RpoE activity)